MVDIELNKARFIKIYEENIKREGSDKLLKWLCDTDFFVAPASSKFHNAVTGGLCGHSLNVYDRAVELVEAENKKENSLFKNISAESIAISTLLHDLCKVDYYKVSLRNQKNEFGTWEQVPYFQVDEKLPYGHGEKSVYMISGFMRLTREEAMAINWHMGGFDKRVIGGDYSISKAFSQFPFATLVHIADIMATYFDEDRE